MDGGASVSVVVEANGDTTVDVRRGALRVKAGGEEQHVGAGEQVRVQKGQPLKRALATPVPLAPADGATVATLDVALSWRAVSGASRYVVEVSATQEMTAPKIIAADATRAVIHLDAGTWYWRVVALDGGGATGKRGGARRLVIDTTPPKLKTGKPQWQ